MILNKFRENVAKLKHAGTAIRKAKDRNMKKKKMMKQEHTRFHS
jgi:hypothetical protein